MSLDHLADRSDAELRTELQHLALVMVFGTLAERVRRGAITALVAIALQRPVEFSLQMPGGNAARFAVISLRDPSSTTTRSGRACSRASTR